MIACYEIVDASFQHYEGPLIAFTQSHISHHNTFISVDNEIPWRSSILNLYIHVCLLPEARLP